METFLFFMFCVVGGAIFIVSYQSKQNRKRNRLKILCDAEKTYQKGLSELKIMPTNADLKELVLNLGREYSRLTRNFQGIEGITVVDEVAIMNDINAACAAATPFTTESETKNKQSIENRLEKLSELKQKNLINEQEYSEKKQKILDEI